MELHVCVGRSGDDKTIHDGVRTGFLIYATGLGKWESSGSLRQGEGYDKPKGGKWRNDATPLAEKEPSELLCRSSGRA